MRNLLNFLVAFICFAVIQPSAEAAKPVKGSKASKERLVLMPLRIPDEDKSLAGSMETALVEGLQPKYEVFSGEQVAQKAKAIFLKESKNTTKKDCDETRCMQDIAEAFQAELIATANVTKRPDGYFLALSVQNIFDNKVVYSKSMPCRNCDAYEVVEKLKELSGATVQAKPLAITEEPVVALNTNNPESELWVEVQKGNSIDDYTAYLKQYPKGKYIALAQSRLNKFKNEAAAEAAQQEKSDWHSASSTASEESFEVYLSQYPKGKYVVLAQSRLKKVKEDTATEAGRMEQQAWQAADQSGTEASYQGYLQDYPQGRNKTQAQARIKKLQTDQVAREEAELWNKANSNNDKAAVQSYLSQYPRGRHVAAANAKLKLIKEEAAKGPAMVRIPGKNYELGKYEVTQKEWRDVMGNNPSNFTNCGDTCPVQQVSWDDIQTFLQKLNAESGRQYRLPTEAEWEYACYGGTQTEYCGGNDIDSVAWYYGNSNQTTHPAGQKQANGYGLYDMSGNVWEWQSDCFDGNCADGRVLRGGSWFFTPRFVRAAYRFWNFPSLREHDYGFRLARTLP